MEDKEIIVPKGDHLLKILNELPNGRLIKDSTGVGATTVELRSERNSIICEPLRSIIDSKANSHKTIIDGQEGPEIFVYYGGVEKNKLKEYVDGKPAYCKILVTSERLGILIRDLKELGFKVYRDFFLLIDEVDLYQIQSDFRPYLSIATDHYPMFKNRAILSATMYPFCNPMLAKEPKTKIKWDGKIKRKINLIVTNDVIQSVVNHIHDFDGRTFVFVNNINGILDIVEKSGIERKKVAAYCGVDEGNKERLADLYQKFTSTPTHKYNFYTSAYFSGCDLECSGNLITVMDANVEPMALNPGQIKQIGGRLRKGMHNDLIIAKLARSTTKIRSKEEFNEYYEALFQQAKMDLDYIEKKAKTKFQWAKARKVKKGLFQTSLFARINEFEAPEIDYNLIDNELIKVDSIKSLYTNKNKLIEFFEKYDDYSLVKTWEEKHESLSSLSRMNSKKTLEKVKEITGNCLSLALDQLNLIPELLPEIPVTYLGLLMVESKKASSKVKPFLEYLVKQSWYDPYPFVDEYLESTKGKVSELLILESRMEFMDLPADHPRKKLVEQYFKKGKQYSNKQVFEGMKPIMKELFNEDIKTTNKAVKALKLFYEIKGINAPRIDGEKRGKDYKIMGYLKNPKTGKYL